MESITEFHHIKYVPKEDSSSPFVLPKPELFLEKIRQTKDCVNPNKGRKKEALEKYPTDTLSMRGTLGDLGISWALIETANGSVHRVKVGNYLGKYHGRITKVKQRSITIIELIPDAVGCWVERESIIDMDVSRTGARN